METSDELRIDAEPLLVPSFMHIHLGGILLLLLYAKTYLAHSVKPLYRTEPNVHPFSNHHGASSIDEKWESVWILAR